MHASIYSCLVVKKSCWYIAGALWELMHVEMYYWCIHGEMYSTSNTPSPSYQLKVYNENVAAASAKLLQSCLTLCDPIDGSPPGSPIPGILQARTMEWVAISFSNAWKWKVNVRSLSHVWLVVTPWTAAYQAPPSMGFSRQEYWSGVPLPSLVEYCYTRLLTGLAIAFSI